MSPPGRRFRHRRGAVQQDGGAVPFADGIHQLPIHHHGQDFSVALALGIADKLGFVVFKWGENVLFQDTSPMAARAARARSFCSFI